MIRAGQQLGIAKETTVVPLKELSNDLSPCVSVTMDGIISIWGLMSTIKVGKIPYDSLGIIRYHLEF